ncbi:MAG: serine--tRNA ligase, partial [Microbacteriaceae bacterium]|nr:serine--tRNA ligase [Microbacteriaceae bacterium]
MIDPHLLRNDPDTIRRSQRARGNDESSVDAAIAADEAHRAALSEFETLRAEQNQFGKQVKAAAKEEKPALIQQAQQLAAGVKAAEARSREAEGAFEVALSRIENLVIDGVPSGGEENFVTLREVGEVPSFDFEPRDHLELGELLDAIDMERGAKVSGSRFYFLKGIGARLELALMSLALDRALAAGFVPLIP